MWGIGLPLVITNDQGTNFTASLMREFMKFQGTVQVLRPWFTLSGARMD